MNNKYRLRKVFAMRMYAPPNVWQAVIDSGWSGRQDYITWIVDLYLETNYSIVSEWLIENGADKHETVLLDLSL
jgi:hypothetical protein